MTTIRTIQYSQFTVLAAVLCLSMCGCHSQPEVREYQPTQEEQRQIEEGTKKTNEEMKKLTTGYGKEMQHVAPDYPTPPISQHKKAGDISQQQQPPQQQQPNSTQP